MAYIVPVLFIAVFAFAAVKKVNVFNTFTKGVKGALEFVVSLIPCLAAIFMMCALFEVSTLSSRLIKFISPAVEFLGIPKELTKLIIIKPFSGSGSIAYLSEIIKEHGADSYISRCACVCFGSSETVFYICSVYFAGLKVKKLSYAVICVLISCFFTTVLACLLCRVL